MTQLHLVVSIPLEYLDLYSRIVHVAMVSVTFAQFCITIVTGHVYLHILLDTVAFVHLVSCSCALVYFVH